MLNSARPYEGFPWASGHVLECVGSPDELIAFSVSDERPYDVVAGYSIGRISSARHDGRPARLINLYDEFGGYETGRLIVLENDVNLRWFRVFPDKEERDEFLEFVEEGRFDVPPGFRLVKARQLDKGDEVQVTLGDNVRVTCELDMVVLTAADRSSAMERLYEAPDGTDCPSGIAVHLVSDDHELDMWLDSEADVPLKDD